MISPYSTGLSMSEISQFAKSGGKGNSGIAIVLWQQIQDTLKFVHIFKTCI